MLTASRLCGPLLNRLYSGLVERRVVRFRMCDNEAQFSPSSCLFGVTVRRLSDENEPASLCFRIPFLSDWRVTEIVPFDSVRVREQPGEPFTTVLRELTSLPGVPLETWATHEHDFHGDAGLDQFSAQLRHPTERFRSLCGTSSHREGNRDQS